MDFQVERDAMVRDQMRARGIVDERVLSAMASVPREEFVGANEVSAAYRDGPQDIACGQTISQPYMVAFTCEAARLRPTDRVLEVGAGSGYQAAVLGALAEEVHSVERHVELARHAAEVLQRLGMRNVFVHVGDGSRGLADFAPFDAILVAAAAPAMPHSLAAQLATGGRLIIPVGPREKQRLCRYTRTRSGDLVEERLLSCRYVPLVGAEGWPQPTAAKP